jgi:hypothetical protein
LNDRVDLKLKTANAFLSSAMGNSKIASDKLTEDAILCGLHQDWDHFAHKNAWSLTSFDPDFAAPFLPFFVNLPQFQYVRKQHCEFTLTKRLIKPLEMGCLRIERPTLQKQSS